MRDEEKIIERHPDANRAVRGSRVQGRRSPVLRSSHLRSRVLGSLPTPVRQLINSTKGKKERIGKIFQMHANKENPVDSVTAGHIYAVIGLKDTTTGDTLCDPNNQVVLESMTFPEPVIEVAIEPKTKADQEKLGVAIQKLAEEDPTFRTEQNQDTGQTVIKGMGELHLDILVDRMKREFNVEANVGKPQVAYRETIRRIVDKHDYTHKKQTGGSGQFAKVQISLEPLEVTAEKIYEFENKVTGGRIPREYIGSIDAGFQDVDGRSAFSPATRWSASRRSSSMVLRTMSTPRKWRSRSPARWPSRKQRARRSPCCSSRSWPSRYVPPRSTWATSSAT